MKALRALLAWVSLLLCGSQVPAADLPAHLAGLAEANVSIATGSGTHRFRVWLAEDYLSRQQGLMHLRELPAGRGMLFVFDRPQYVSFWMKDTYISLDLAFIDANGLVVNIASGTRPLSVDPILSAAPVRSVLELAAGTAARIGLKPGDRVTRTPP